MVPLLELLTLSDPMMLFEMVIEPGVPAPAIIPLKRTAVEVVVWVKLTLPVPVPLPSVFPETVPMLNAPVTAEIKDWLEDVLELVMLMFCMVLP